MKIDRNFKKRLKIKLTQKLLTAIQHGHKNKEGEWYITPRDIPRVLPKIVGCATSFFNNNYDSFYHAGSSFSENEELLKTLEKLTMEQLTNICIDNGIDCDPLWDKYMIIGVIISRQLSLTSVMNGMSYILNKLNETMFKECVIANENTHNK